MLLRERSSTSPAVGTGNLENGGPGHTHFADVGIQYALWTVALSGKSKRFLRFTAVANGQKQRGKLCNNGQLKQR